MTYEIASTQYGHGKLGATLGDYVVAFSLRRGRKEYRRLTWEYVMMRWLGVAAGSS
jgi:hypothetical protein